MLVSVIGIVGTGWADRVQIPALQRAGLTVGAIAGRRRERAEEVAAQHGIDYASDDWHDLLERDLDLIVVSATPALHAEISVAALDAGMHVLCEKPAALDAAEAQRMVDAAAAHPDRLALIDHELRFTPVRSKARELLRQGAIGRLLTVTARVASGTRVDPEVPWNWWSDAKQGGGVLGALGSHVLDGVRWLTDEEPEVRGATLGRAHPRRTDAEGVEREVTSEDIASLTFRVGSAVGTMLVHQVAHDEPVDLVTLRGTRGTLVIDRSLRLFFGKEGAGLKEYRAPLPKAVPNRFRSSGYAAGTVLFAQALARYLAGEPEALEPAATMRDGLAVQRLLDEAKRLAGEPS